MKKTTDIEKNQKAFSTRKGELLTINEVQWKWTFNPYNKIVNAYSEQGGRYKINGEYIASEDTNEALTDVLEGRIDPDEAWHSMDWNIAYQRGSKFDITADDIVKWVSFKDPAIIQLEFDELEYN